MVCDNLEDEEKLHPGTIPAAEWLNRLKQHQALYGHGTVPVRSRRAPSTEAKALCQWIERMRRMAHSGQLPLATAFELASCGIRLDQKPERQRATALVQNAAFERNIENIQAWIAEHGYDATLDYLASRNDEKARRCYTFMEHMRLKSRQNLLSWEHRRILLDLRVRINGQRTEDWLTTDPSIRKRELSSDIELPELVIVEPADFERRLALAKGFSGYVYATSVAGAYRINRVTGDSLKLEMGSTWKIAMPRALDTRPGAPIVIELKAHAKRDWETGLLGFAKPVNAT